MGALYSKISRLHLDDKNEEPSETVKETNFPQETRTPCKLIKYLVDPRSASAGIKRTPLMVTVGEMGTKLDGNDTPVRPLPYLETDLDESKCTIRTSTPVISASPMQDILHSSPVLPRAGSPASSSDEMSTSEQDELFSINSDEEDGNEMLNNERMLFESEDQGSFEEEGDRKVYERPLNKLQNNKVVQFISEDACDAADTEVEEILCSEVTKTASENTLEREFTEIEDCLFSAINSPSVETDTEKSQNAWVNIKFGQQFKNKQGRIPLSVVSSNPCSPRQLSNILKMSPSVDTSKDAKSWRGITEERANRGLLDVENTPPIGSLPPPDIIQSAPGKLLLANRGCTGKTAWARDSSLII